MRAFDWCQNQRPWMTLNGHYALCFKNTCVFGAHRENLNEDRPILSLLAVWVSDPSFWQHKVYADIRGGFPGEGRQTTMGYIRINLMLPETRVTDPYCQQR